MPILTSRRLALVPVLALATSCALPRTMTQDAVAFNRTLEDANNQMLLLNVLRARDRYPLYLTAMTALRGNLKSSVDLSTELGLSKAAGVGTVARSLTPTLDTAYATNPSFDVAPLDSDEFTKGFMTPLKLETVEYYLSQGWPASLVFHLALRKFEVARAEPDGWHVMTFTSHASDAQENQAFEDALGYLVADCRLGVVATDRDTPVGPAVEATSLADLAGAAKAGLVVRTEAGKARLYQTSHELGFAVTLPERPTRTLGGGDDAPGASHAAAAGRLASHTEPATVEGLHESLKLLDTRPQDLKVTFHLRSPEAIVYYLGEIVRGGPESALVRRDGGRPAVPLFVIEPGRAEGWEAAVATVYRGQAYHIPASREAAGETMHVLALLTQLIGQYKKNSDLPTSRTAVLSTQ